MPLTSSESRFIDITESLVKEISAWAEMDDWVTKPYPKRLRAVDQTIFEISSLYLQKGPIRLLLDPVAYDVPGAEAAVDLYLMPTYDDLASLYCKKNQWTIHYNPLCEMTDNKKFDTVSSPLDRHIFISILSSIFENVTPSI
ncbi:MAG: hypothetical protein ACKO0V_24070 [bacterium]